ncbi:MAG TPA: cyclic 2,3-diphosphoglycerate synthase [Caldisericia bacterium]|nr:cyclic 2,3-diphosphoglycerate synthase [Caldisericia bacterium]
MKRNVLIMGAAGRDFHNFNVYFRDNDEFDVKAFTATQIPNITERKYPFELAGKLYPNGIQIYPEEELTKLIDEFKIDVVCFSYSDVSHEYVMHKASEVIAEGADFWLLGYDKTAISSSKPVISVCAVRTGSGKSQTSRKIVKILSNMGKRVVSIRHPMPYGDLRDQIVQRFENISDFEKYKCTIEEMEEYEPYIKMGAIIYAGVDYEKILRQAETEADIILWDGGNNDLPFYKTDFHIVVADPLRPYHEVSYHPGEANIRMADVVIINKIESADLENIITVRENIMQVNPKATILEAASPLIVDDPSKIKGKNVIVIEDGPTLTHGEMDIGAGFLAAKMFGASSIVDPKPYAVGSIKDAYEKFPNLDMVVPALGYSEKQLKELEETINNSEADTVIIGTPVDLRRLFTINKQTVKVDYVLQEIGSPNLEDLLKSKFKN